MSRSIVEARMITKAHELMAALESTTENNERVLAAIRNLVIGSHFYKKAFLQHSFVKSVTSILRSCTDEQKQTHDCITIISSLSMVNESSQIIIENGAYAEMLRFISTQNSRTFVSLCRAMSALSSSQPIALASSESDLFVNQIIHFLVAAPASTLEPILVVLSQPILQYGSQPKELLLVLVDIVAKSLLSSQVKIQLLSLDALTSLAHQSEIVSQFFCERKHMVHTLLCLVKGIDETLKSKAIKCAMSLGPQFVSVLTQAQMVLFVVAFSQLLNPEATSIDGYIVKSLNTFLMSDPAVRKSCVEAGILSKLISLLRKHSTSIQTSDRTVCVQIIDCLIDLCDGSESNKITAFNNGILTGLVQCLETKSNSQLQLSCWTFVRCLSRVNRQYRVTLAGSPIFSHLLKELSGTNSTVQGICLDIISNIALENRGLKDYFMTDRQLSTFVELMESKEEHIRVASIRVLGSILYSLEDDIKMYLASKGVFALPLSKFVGGSVPEKIAILRCLQNFAFSPRGSNSGKITLDCFKTELNVILPSAFDSLVDDVVLEAVKLLRNVFSSQGADIAVILEHGILGKICSLLTHTMIEMRVVAASCVMNILMSAEGSSQSQIAETLHSHRLKEALQQLQLDDEPQVRDRAKVILSKISS